MKMDWNAKPKRPLLSFAILYLSYVTVSSSVLGCSVYSLEVLWKVKLSEQSASPSNIFVASTCSTNHKSPTKFFITTWELVFSSSHLELQTWKSWRGRWVFHVLAEFLDKGSSVMQMSLQLLPSRDKESSQAIQAPWQTELLNNWTTEQHKSWLLNTEQFEQCNPSN